MTQRIPENDTNIVCDCHSREPEALFGVVMMIGGNIPGETRVLSIALYDYVESLQFAEAHRLAAGLVVFSLVLLFLLAHRQPVFYVVSLWTLVMADAAAALARSGDPAIAVVPEGPYVVPVVA